MGSEVVEAIAALVVGLALIWLVLQPIVAPAPQAPEAYEPPDPEETPRGRALLALKEIEFDRATGKLSDDDYTMLHNRYSARALAVLDEAAEPLAGTSGQAPAAGGPSCPTCGGGTVPHAAFCGACGTSLSGGIPSRTTP
jgi:hypothetical protein